MRKTGMILMLALGVSAVGSLASAQEATGQNPPQLVVDQKVIDLGEIPQGVVKDVTFTLRNEGGSVLTIRSVRPSCGCTVADFDKEIQPGGTGEVRAKLDTSNFKTAISKSIHVMSDDPVNPTMTLVIKAVVEPVIDVLPRALVRFNALQKEKSVQKVVLAGTKLSGPFEVTGVTTDNDALKVSYKKLGEGEGIEGKSGTQYEVTISLADDAPVGPISSVVTVHTTVEAAKDVEIKVFGVLRALLQVTPPEVQFGAVEAARTPGRNVVIVNNRPNTEVDLTNATIDDPAFTAKIVRQEPGKRYEVTVSVKADAKPGVKDATLVLKTTDPDFPELKIPVKASLR